MRLSNGPLRTLTAPAGATSFGYRIAALGDVNGDGFGDVGIASQPTTWYVYHGSPTGLSPAAMLTVTRHAGGSPGPVVLRALGDVDGDGFDDVGAPAGARDAFSIVVPETYAARSIVIYTGLYRSGARMPATQSGTRPDRDRVRGPEITILPWFR